MATLFVDRLTVADFSYVHADRGLLGESWIVDVCLTGALDGQGMVLDFGEVKKTIKAWIDAQMDHRLLVPRDSDKLSLSPVSGGHRLEFVTGKGKVIHEGPEESLCQVPGMAVTTKGVAAWLEDRLQALLPDSVSNIEVRLREPQWTEPYYHYSHGLQQHAGNCQRIAHGHRSPIRIWLNDTLDQAWMRTWAERFEDRYLATRAHVRTHKDGMVELAYEAEQGAFRLCLPESQIYFMDTPTTVEWIAHHVAQQTASETGACVRVQAFEGLDKGAIAYA